MGVSMLEISLVGVEMACVLEAVILAVVTGGVVNERGGVVKGVMTSCRSTLPLRTSRLGDALLHVTLTPPPTRLLIVNRVRRVAGGRTWVVVCGRACVTRAGVKSDMERSCRRGAVLVRATVA